MPVTWTIDHDRRLVHTIAEGPVTLQEIEQHLDKLLVENVLSYDKIFDATDLEPLYSEKDMYAMAARLSAYSQFESGPLAVVANRTAAVIASERFINLSMSKRPARIFESMKQARAWLEGLTEEERSQG